MADNEDFIPDGDFVADPVAAVPSTGVSNGPDFIPDESFVDDEEKYTGLGQQLKGTAEAALSAATFGLSTGVETGLGIATPEDIRGRAEQMNPLVKGVAQVGGIVGTAFALPTVGAAAILGKAGVAGAQALGVGVKGAGVINQIGGHAVRGAIESALFQGGEEVSKAFREDPNQTAEAAAADIGLATVLGGVFGGALGAASEGLKKVAPKFVSEVERSALEGGEFAAIVKHADDIKQADKDSILGSLGKEKANARQIRAAAKELGDAPVLEGMVSDAMLVQKAEDALLDGAPTYSALRRQKLYAEAHKAVDNAANRVIGAADNSLSKAELGDNLKKSIISQLEEQNAPIKAMYDKLKQVQEVIPVDKDLGTVLKKTIGELQELRVAPNSAEGKMISRVINEIDNAKTVDDLKVYKSTIDVSPTASSGEKRMAGILRDRITQLEEDATESFAKTFTKNDVAGLFQPGELEGLQAARRQAKGSYKEFIGRVQTLSEQLGKGRVHGVTDAVRFINDLAPEQVTQRLFSKNNSEFLTFFKKEFPEQMAQMKEYQKSVLRDAATKDGVLSAKALFKAVDKMEPEIQKALFTEAELKTLKAAKTYSDSFPKKFNPSGTSGMNAFRQFFEHPVGAAVSNARDLGVEAFVKLANQAPQVKNAQSLGNATVRAFKTMSKAAKSVFDADAALPSNVINVAFGREKLDRLVTEAATNPEKLFGINDNNPIDEYSQSFAATSARAVRLLSALKPNTDQQSPMDGKRKASQEALGKYHRALDIANKPMILFDSIKKGSVTAFDIATLQQIYPSLYGQMRQQLVNNLIEAKNKGVVVPYSTRIGLSLFLGQPLDSTLTPASILAAQPKPTEQGGEVNSDELKPPPASSMKALTKSASAYRTPSQAAEMSGKARDK